MSMNLMWEKKGEKRLIEFPFQSNTNLTYAVLAEKDIDKRMALLGDDLMSRRDDVWAQEKLNEIKEKLLDEDYSLVMI